MTFPRPVGRRTTVNRSTVRRSRARDPRIWFGVLWIFAALMVPATSVVNAAPGDPLVFAPVADGQVQAAYPTSNYGTRTTMRVRDGSSAAQSYLKFEVTGLAGTPTAIRLHLWVDDGSPDGGILYRVSDSWAEDTLDWTTAPALAGAPVGNAGSVDAGTWVDIALDPTTITADGTLSLAIGNGGSNSAYYATREHPNPPQLIIEQAGGGPPPSPSSSTSSSPSSSRHPRRAPRRARALARHRALRPRRARARPARPASR